ncbi:MAG: hypothetical protein A2020_15100 [Lentisphaerae bacterium GWF2_45_14]|nr:MAG: hypothetical protein A2020_15100 [Lentisphaerae bacterium GWF2_45_14]
MKNKIVKCPAGRLMSFSGIDGNTDFENGLILRGAFKFSGFDIKFPGDGHIAFENTEPSESVFFSDWFSCGKLRGVFIDAYHFIIEGPCRTDAEDLEIKIISENGKTLIGIKNFFNKKLILSDVDALIDERAKWSKQIVSEQGNKGNFFINALSQMKGQVYSPEGIIKHRWTTPDKWPHRRMWLWDSVFHAIGLRHIDIELAKNSLDAVLDVQREDGFIAHMADPLGISKITQPPVLALGYKLVNEYADDLEWLGAAYPKLKKYLQWDMKNRDSDGYGLLEWYIEADANCRSGESGMDNSPRFDAATQLDATDFNSMLALEFEIMAEFAETLGLKDDAASWRMLHKTLCNKINQRLWNGKENFYFDYDVTKNEMSEVMASSGFMPLICGACSKEQATAIEKHIYDSETFGTALVIPSIAVKSEKFYSKDMWRGPVWINVNWMVACGFRRYGMNDTADFIIRKTVEEIEAMFGKYGTFFEFFDDRCELDPSQLLRKGKNVPDSFHQPLFDYGWTATLYIDMLYWKYGPLHSETALSP